MSDEDIWEVKVTQEEIKKNLNIAIVSSKNNKEAQQDDEAD
jgi:hypothetical protein